MLSVKLTALVRARAAERRPPPPEAVPVPFPPGAAVRLGDAAWVLVDGEAARGLGPALAWARQQGAGALHVVVDDPAVAGVLARRAASFAAPPTVWWVDGRALVAAEPAPFPPDPPLDPAATPFFDLLTRVGVDPVVEHGVLRGEILGLEIARVVPGEAGPRLEVGVGRHDREAFALVHGDVPTDEALAGVAGHVRRHRRPGARPHPLNRLAPERWLRAQVLADPASVGADHLAPLAPTVPVADIRARQPAPAAGVDRRGEPLVVVCSTGVDLDLVPAAADARRRDGRDARLVLAVPERDAHPVTRALAGALAQPAEVLPRPGEPRLDPAGRAGDSDRPAGRAGYRDASAEPGAAPPVP